MSKNLYPHERISNSIYMVANKNPVLFIYVCYYIFPLIAFISEMILLNYIGLYMDTYHLLYIQNEKFILVGLNIIPILALILLIFGTISSYKLCWRAT
jgi:hypothetical protein